MFRQLSPKQHHADDDSSAASSWQEKVLSVSQGVLYDALTDADDDFRNYNAPPIDNVSSLQHCCCCSNNNLEARVLCGEDTTGSHHYYILEKILRWVKLIILKLARSYYALPIILVALPLTVGLFVGFWVGRKYEQQNHNNKQQQQQKRKYHWGESLLYRILSLVGNNLWSGVSREPCSRKPQQIETPLAPPQVMEPQTNDPSDLPEKTLALTPSRFPESREEMLEREEMVRTELRSDRETQRESSVSLDKLPKHIAVIMDGNRRYGNRRYGRATSGHWDGSRKLLSFAKWCIAERIQILTVYAFSTENWRRDPSEVASLMGLFAKYCEELRQEAITRNIRVHVLSTDTCQIPVHVKAGLERLEEDTKHCKGGLLMNICLSYGSRGEIVNGCRTLASRCVSGRMDVDNITEKTFQNTLLSRHSPDPDVLIRTSGEMRISNFLLWQLAYTELFFLDKTWPEVDKNDLLQVIRTYAKGRTRRFGK